MTKGLEEQLGVGLGVYVEQGGDRLDPAHGLDRVSGRSRSRQSHGVGQLASGLAARGVLVSLTLSRLERSTLQMR